MNNLPPLGCTQYFFGNTIGTVQSYNFDGGMHLADQAQNICVRQERGNCRICWTATSSIDFAVSGKVTSKMGNRQQNECCRYGHDGLGTRGYDCLAIYGAESVNGGHQPSRVCGRSEGIITGANAGSAATICCK